MKKAKYFIFGLCVLYFSCGSPPVPRTIINSFSIEKPFDVVWVAMIEAFEDMKIPIQTIEKTMGWLTPDTSYYDCGTLPLTTANTESRGRFKAVLMKLTDSSCQFKISAEYETIIHYDTGPKTYPCVSTGAMESAFHKMVTAKIR
jgi:hypothetical protein